MLFSRESRELVLSGEKRMTCRAWLNRRVRVGHEYWAQTKMLDSSSRFAKIKIISVEEWDGVTLSGNEVIDEGYTSLREFQQAYYGYNKNKLPKDVRDRFDDMSIEDLSKEILKLGRKHYAIRFYMVWSTVMEDIFKTVERRLNNEDAFEDSFRSE